MHSAVLEIQDLTTTFETSAGHFRAVEDISFAIEPGQVFALVGESGCGKTVTALSIMRLLGPAADIKGRVLLEGTNLPLLSDRDMQELRGKQISMIFQNPLNALNPALRIGDQIAEVIRAHGDRETQATRKRSLLRTEDRASKVWEQVVELLRRVRIPAPEESADRWPHELSGGMRQRSAIAMALACSPKVIIADEPTTALDVTVQRQIVLLLEDVRRTRDVGILLISHDIALVAEFAHRAAVMYAGQVVECAEVEQLLSSPLHQYTQALLACVPTIDERRPLESIPGSVPALYDTIVGCRFRNSCSISEQQCAETMPRLREIEEGHWVKCHLV